MIQHLDTPQIPVASKNRRHAKVQDNTIALGGTDDSETTKPVPSRLIFSTTTDTNQGHTHSHGAMVSNKRYTAYRKAYPVPASAVYHGWTNDKIFNHVPTGASVRMVKRDPRA